MAAVLPIRSASSADVPRRTPPLRAQPDQPDELDGQRRAYYDTLYDEQTVALLPRDRSVEENARMLAGDQWLVYHTALGRFYDLRDFLTSAEKRWRQQPVINMLLRWFILSHARMTENPPLVTWKPGPDASDNDIAEVLDVASKLAWRSAHMDDVIHRLTAWMLVAGRAHTISFLDPDAGEWKVRTADVPVPMLGPQGEPLGLTREPVPSAPLDANWQPAVALAPGGRLVPIAQPHIERSGQIAVDVHSCLEVRAEWGPTPFWRKRWHALETWHTPEDVYDRWGVDVQPSGGGSGRSSSLATERLLYGAGFFAHAMGRMGQRDVTRQMKDLVKVRRFWVRPTRTVEGMTETPDSPGGRFILIVGDQVVRDGPRELAYPFVSPLNTFGMTWLPGQPQEITPQTSLNGPQRYINKLSQQTAAHANLLSDPKAVFDSDSGIDSKSWTNEPGTGVKAIIRPNVPPVQYVTPPALGESVYREKDMMWRVIEHLGNLEGTSARPPDRNSSGKLIEELRFNDDRFVGPTLRAMPPEFARMFQTWRVMMPLVWDREQVLSIAGDDNIVRTVNVLPDLFTSGTVNAEPDVESMLPEGLGERRQRVFMEYKENMYGPVGSAQAVRTYMEKMRFPHDDRLITPDAVDALTAEQENGLLVKGATDVPVLPWYDDAVHLERHLRVMKRREFLKYPPPIQQGFILHVTIHQERLAAQMARQRAALLAEQRQQRALPAGDEESAERDHSDSEAAPV